MNGVQAVIVVTGALGSLLVALFFAIVWLEGWREAFVIIGTTLAFLAGALVLTLFWFWVAGVLA